MIALTLTQPWATLVAIGAKRVETRSWPTKYRGELAIHAAKGFPGSAKDLCYSQGFRQATDWPSPEDFIDSDKRAAEKYNCIRSDPQRLTQEWLDEIAARIKALPLGAVIATCRLVACVPTVADPNYACAYGVTDEYPHLMTAQELAFGNYEPGRFAWILEDVKPLTEPVAVRGALGLWEWKGAR